VSSRLEALTSALESQSLAQGVIAHTAVARVGEPGPPGQPTPTGQIPSELQVLADEYLAVEIPDWAARVRAKDELALRLGSYVIAHRVSKDLLAVQENEGLLVGLASAVNALPRAVMASGWSRPRPG
jgi:hypothetical protein